MVFIHELIFASWGFPYVLFLFVSHFFCKLLELVYLASSFSLSLSLSISLFLSLSLSLSVPSDEVLPVDGLAGVDGMGEIWAGMPFQYFPKSSSLPGFWTWWWTVR
jgi:hypothetical protein